MPDRLLNTLEAVAYLKEKWGMVRTPGTMRRLRSTGGGPPFLKDASGAVGYTGPKLDAWVEGRLSEHASTASYPPGSGWRRPRRPRDDREEARRLFSAPANAD